MAGRVRRRDGNDRERTPLIRNSSLAAIELLVSLAVVAAGLAGLVPFSTTPPLLLIGAWFLRIERRSWRELGLARTGSVTRTLLLGVGGGLVLQGVFLFVLGPWIERLAGAPPDLGQFAEVAGDEARLALGLFLVWALAAFGEELVYRGTLGNRVAGLAGGSRGAWLASLFLVNLLFAIGHAYQGLAGVIATGIAGVFFGLLYLATGRNLWASILAHGTFNTVGLVLLYLGAVPGS